MPRKGFMFGKKKRYAKSRRKSTTELRVGDVASPSHNVSKSQEIGTCTTTAERKSTVYSTYSQTQDSLSADFYDIIHCTFLPSILSAVVCASCKTSNFHITVTAKKGLASLYKLCCDVCDTTVWTGWTSPITETKRHDVNYRAVLACKETGVSLTKLLSMFAILSIKSPFHHKTYEEISTEVHSAVVQAAEESMQAAAAVVHERALSKSDTVRSNGCPAVAVSFDGTWHKRGHSSHSGVGVAIEFDTGLVLDAQVISNYCKACEMGPKPGNSTYLKWHRNHNWKCQKNFEGSSNAMEAEAAQIIFQRSVRKRSLVYGTMLCDGDSKAFHAAQASCGYDISITKEDCINHIAKRMFNALENLKKSNKDSLNYRLTKPNIEKITNTYAVNLKCNAPDPAKMKFGVLGGFFHMLSTDSQPNHRLCPDGENSWCHYKRSIATNAPFRKHTPTITADVGKLVFPIIKRLTEPELLQRCAKMGTQNANESFNSLIWLRCPKVEFASKRSVETATYLAILAFNCGRTGIKLVMDKLNLKWTTISNSYFTNKQKLKLTNAKKRTLGISKWKRKTQKKRRIETEHGREKKEGISYAAGEFNI